MVTGDSKAWIGTNSGIISLPYDPDNLTLVKQYSYQYNIPSTTTYNSYGASNAPAYIDTGLTYPDDISEYKKVRFDIGMKDVRTNYVAASHPYHGTVKVNIGFGSMYNRDYLIYEGMRYEFDPKGSSSHANFHLYPDATGVSVSQITHNWYPLWNEGIPNIACYDSHNTGSHRLRELVGYITPYTNSNGYKHNLYQYIVMTLYDSTVDGSSSCTLYGTIKVTVKCYR